MASWVIHTMIAERLLKMIPGLDIRGFVVGNMAPDCNVENADWTQFTPPREVTHWMTGEGKITADYEGFYEKYVRPDLPNEQYSFYLGYYSHLITDAEFQIFIRRPDRVAECLRRAKSDGNIYEMIKGEPEEFDTLKKTLGRNRMEQELRCIEKKWLDENPGNLYDGVLRRVTQFPDYLDYLPSGAVARKISGMQNDHKDTVVPDTFVFYTSEELDKFVEDTAQTVYKRLTRHGGRKMKAMKYLQDSVYEAASLAEMVEIFRQMCRMNVGAGREHLVFEAGVSTAPVVPEYRQGDIEECHTAAELVTAMMELEEQDIDGLLFPENETMYYFSLVRRFPDVEDEFFQIHLDVLFTPSEANRNITKLIRKDINEPGFFEEVMETEAFKVLSGEEMQEVRVYIDVT